MANDVMTIPVNDLKVMAAAIAESNLFGIKTQQQALALMLIASAEGRHPATVARDYDIIAGRPAKRTEAMLRDFIESGGKVEWHKLDDTIADATFSHPQGGTVRINWDFKRANTAGLGGKDMWKKFPRQMLRNRTVSEGVRTVCPSATSGMYEPGEVQDFAPAKDMGAAEVVGKPIRAVEAALEGVPEPSADEMASLRETAALVVQMVEADGNPAGAYQYVVEQNLDSDQMTAFWKLLGPNTKTRAALKKEGAVRAKDSRGEVTNAVENVHSQAAQ